MNWYSKKKGSNPVAGHRVTRSAGILFVASLLALFMVIAGALPALADRKIYPGSMGVRINGTSTPWHHSSIGNPSDDTWLLLDLPVIHDSIPGHILGGWVRMVDQHHDYDICCWLNSYYRIGCAWVGWLTPRKCSLGCGCHAQHINFPGIGANSISHYYYTCKIPPRNNGNISYITSYFVDE